MTETRIIQLVATASGDASPHNGEYVVSFDPDPRPHGTLRTTRDKAKAKRFENPMAAFTFYRQAHGRRPDGRPNCPLTAWTVEIFPPDLPSLSDKLNEPPA
jgi:hypothetical protein